MKILFGQVPDAYKEDDDYFTGQDGNSYYFEIEVYQEDELGLNGVIRINDRCDRYMPIDFENLGSLIRALTTLQEYRNDKLNFAEFWQARWKQG